MNFITFIYFYFIYFIYLCTYLFYLFVYFFHLRKEALKKKIIYKSCNQIIYTANMPWKCKPSTFQEGFKTIGFSVSERIRTTVNENILMI